LRRRAAQPAAAARPLIPAIRLDGSGTVLDGGEVGGTTTIGGGLTGGTSGGLTGGTTTIGGGLTGGVTTPIGGGGLIGGKKACAVGIDSVNGTIVSVAVGTIIFQRIGISLRKPRG
jgi:hypothetical protein